MKEPNKYQEALSVLKEEIINEKTKHSVPGDMLVSGNLFNVLEILQELVDKATPKKPIPFKHEVFSKTFYRCECSQRLGSAEKPSSYCPRCGQALDWSKDNE